MYKFLIDKFNYIFIFIAISFFRVPYFKTMTIKGDEGYFLMMGDLLLQGKKLYVDFLPLNSPLSVFFYVLPNLFPKEIFYTRIITLILIYITSLMIFHISKKYIHNKYALLAPICYIFQLHFLEEGVGQALITEHIINFFVILFVFYALKFRQNENIKNVFLLTFIFILTILSRVNFILLGILLLFFCFKNYKLNFNIFFKFLFSSMIILIFSFLVYLLIWEADIDALKNYLNLLGAYSEKHSYLAYFKNTYYNIIELEYKYIFLPIISLNLALILISIPFYLSHYFILTYLYNLYSKKINYSENNTLSILIGSLILITISLVIGPEIRSTHIFMVITINSFIFLYTILHSNTLSRLKNILYNNTFNFFIFFFSLFYLLISFSNTDSNKILLENKFINSSYYHNEEHKLLEMYRDIKDQSCFIGHSYHARWLNGSDFCYLFLFESFHNKKNLVKNIYKINSIQKYYHKRLIGNNNHYVYVDKRLFEIDYPIENGTENVVDNETRLQFFEDYKEIETKGNVTLFKLNSANF